MTNGDDPFKPGTRYSQSILFLMICLALFEAVNGGLNISLLLQKNESDAERSRVTREIIINVGYCLKLPDIHTRQEIRQCVEQNVEDYDGTQR